MRSWTTAALLAALCTMLLGWTPGASAATYEIRGAASSDGKATFAVAKLRGKKVRRAEVRVGARKRKVTAKQVRRAATRRGKLTVRVPKAPTRKRATAKRPAPTGAAPAAADAPPTAAQPDHGASDSPLVEGGPTTADDAGAQRSGGGGGGSAPVLVVVVEDQPAPAPAPSTGTCDGPTSDFRAGRWPAACWRPYADSSPFNQPIPAGAPAAANSDGYVRRLVGFGSPQNLLGGTADTTADFGHPTYYATAGDPLYTVHCAESWGRCAVEGLQVRIPAAARAAGGSDGHMTVVDEAAGWEYDFWQVRSKPADGGTITISWGGRTRLDGDGLGSDATAARYGNLAGVIRAQELAAGRIDHALFMVIRCDSGTHVYPAQKAGRSCAAAGLPTADAPPMGTRFQLAMTDSEIDALGIPDWKKTILRAMARYGMYFGDTGGSSWGLQFESSSTYTSFGVADPLVALGQKLGVPFYDGHAVFSLKDGVDWAGRLRAVAPCVAQRAC